MSRRTHAARFRDFGLSFSLALSACAPSPSAPAAIAPTETAKAQPVAWHSDTQAAFAAARAENKLVLLNVVASWCHWCHVMDDETYADPRVQARLGASFVGLRLDADANPDIAERYAAWGWPATVVLTPDAQEVRAWRGFVAAPAFGAALDELASAQAGGTLVAAGLDAASAEDADPPPSELSEVFARATAQLDRSYSVERSGWGRKQMYPLGPAIEASLLRAQDPASAASVDHDARASVVLDALQALHDPVWGGVYQYSVGGVWDRPHFEKLTLLQAEILAAYAQIAAQDSVALGGEPALAPARAVFGYLDKHQRTPAGFGASQDADLREVHAGDERGPVRMEGAEYYALSASQREAMGEPPRDLSVYADTNGALAAAFARLGRVDPEGWWVGEALALMRGLGDSHRHPDGGFGHGEAPRAGDARFLGDQVYPLWAMVQLYELTGDRAWRARSVELADILLRDFALPAGGFSSRSSSGQATGVFAQARRPLELNALAARALMRLHRQLDHAQGLELPYAAAARAALLRVGDTKSLRAEGRFIGQYISATLALMRPGVWVTVVGDADTPGIEAMHVAAAKAAAAHVQVVVDRSPPGEFYPGHPGARVFICDTQRCSRPLTQGEKVAPALARFLSE